MRTLGAHHFQSNVWAVDNGLPEISSPSSATSSTTDSDTPLNRRAPPAD